LIFIFTFSTNQTCFYLISEAKAMAEKQMNDMKAQIEGKCTIQ
jgi:hypothetical protein